MKKLLLAATLAVVASAGSAAAQTYPSRPITMIVPFAAGGITDIVARLVSERMKTSLGQPVIAENVAGAGGTIGVTRLFRSAPDGYTIAIGQWTSHVGAGAMYSLPFDYLRRISSRCRCCRSVRSGSSRARICRQRICAS